MRSDRAITPHPIVALHRASAPCIAGAGGGGGWRRCRTAPLARMPEAESISPARTGAESQLGRALLHISAIPPGAASCDAHASDSTSVSPTGCLAPRLPAPRPTPSRGCRPCWRLSGRANATWAANWGRPAVCSQRGISGPELALPKDTSSPPRRLPGRAVKTARSSRTPVEHGGPPTDCHPEPPPGK